MTAEVKLRSMAADDATLQSYFGLAPFRWYDKQIAQGAIKNGLCVRVRRISTVRQYFHGDQNHGIGGLNRLSQPRFQIDVLHATDPEACRVAADAIVQWLQTVDFASGDQWASPSTTPPAYPNFLLNQRGDMDYQLQPPVYVETLDVRIYNLEDN